ncbi:MAG: pitrilysin family protein [Pseudomonadota bacterium]
MAEISELSNGLRIVVDPIPALRSAAVGVWARAGSIDERDSEQGLAHLLEHMAFKGTKTRSARDIAEEIEAVGGYLNAATSHQRTGYYARVLKDDVDLAFDLLADILQNSIFDDVELAREKDVIVQEIGEAADTPDDVVFEQLMAVAYAGSPLARPILGNEASVRRQDRNSISAFLFRHYRPSDMVVAAAGAVEADAVIKRVEKLFGDINAKEETSTRAVTPWVGGAHHDERDIEQSHLAIGFPGVSSIDADLFAMRIYADILGGGMSSRLFQRVREEAGLAYSVYAFSDVFDETGLVGAYLAADADQLSGAAALVYAEMESLTKTVSQSELDRSRAMLRAALLMGLESPAARNEANSAQLMTYGRLLSPEEITNRFDAVTAEDVSRCARRVLETRSPAISIVGKGDMNAIQQAIGG